VLSVAKFYGKVTFYLEVEKVCRSGGNVFPGGGNGVPERWKWYAGVVEMGSRSGGKMKKIGYIGISLRFYSVFIKIRATGCAKDLTFQKKGI
jgi:hypothetical protein